ncbi:MAG: type I methionyl aminopeptidase [Candidatus Levybacteria bacterium]|nr:type I methionyl aminopeptidase [Candidatus Levybacteria bacterium]
MVDIKTEKEIEIMREGGKILAEILGEVLDSIKPGVNELELDEFAERLIREKGGEPAFKKVKGYRHCLCISGNNIVVHGVPTKRKLQEGDVVGVDCGVYYKGFNTDMSETIKVKRQKSKGKSLNEDEIDRFLETGKKALEEAIKVAIVGNRIGHISKTIQEIVEKEGYSVVRALIGHGVGRQLHEDPEVPGFLNKKIEKTPLLKGGMTIAIEVIYNMGGHEVSYLNSDGWTIATSDGSISGLFEKTIAIKEKGPLVLTA